MTEKISYLHFNNPMNPFLFIAILSLLLFFFWIKSRFIREKLIKKNYVIIFTIQTLIFLIILLFITEPVIKQNILTEENAKLIVLFDGSQSTYLRKNHPWKLMFQKDSPLNKSVKNYELEFYIFSEIFKKLDPTKIEIPKLPPGTNIVKSIEDILNQTDKDDKITILIFSDGQDFITPDQIDSLTIRGVPIYTVGLGAKNEIINSISDVNITNVLINNTALLLKPEQIKVTLKAYTQKKETIELVFSADSEIFEKRILNIIPGQSDYDIKHEWLPLNEGIKEISIKASKLNDEIDLENNTFHKKIEVLKDSKNILFVETGLNLESLYLKKFINENLQLNIDSLTIVSSDKITTDTNNLKTGFPQKSILFDYGLIILYNPALNFLSENIQKDIEEYISERGGSLLILYPKQIYENFNQLSYQFKSILPFTYLDEKAFIENSTCELNIKNDLNLQFFQESPVKSSNVSIKIINPFPHLDLKDITKPIFNSKNDLVLNSAGFSHLGKGSISHILFCNSWNWRFNFEMNEFYNYFWTGVLQNLIKLDKKSSNELSYKIHTQKDIYLINEIIRLSIFFNNDIPKDIKNNFSLSLKLPSGKTISLPFQTPFGDTFSIYSSFIPESQGVYEIEGRLKDNNSVIKSNLIINVRKDNREYENLTLNETNLTLLSDATKGKYSDFDDYMKNPFIFEHEKSQKTKVVIKSLWNTPLFMLIILALLSFNWIIRKSANLE